MKKLLLLTLSITLLYLPLIAQTDSKKPLVVIDGRISNIELDSIDVATIGNIEVRQGQSFTDDYGVLAKNGVIRIETKDYIKQNTPENQNNEPLILLNGEVYTSGLNTIDVSIIETITVLKDISATKTYGKAGTNGVLLITTHDSSRLINK